MVTVAWYKGVLCLHLEEGERMMNADEREPPLAVGNYARLNSGSPRLLVVDTAGDDAVTVAWRDDSDEVHERVFPRVCLRRL
jgi:hypothetical protein